MKCEYCENDLPPGVKNCPFCGAACPNNPSMPTFPPIPAVETVPVTAATSAPQPVSPRRRTVYLLLWAVSILTFGTLGLHLIYAGNKKSLFALYGVTAALVFAANKDIAAIGIPSFLALIGINIYSALASKDGNGRKMEW